MQVQAEISAANLRRRIGHIEDVLIDVATDENGYAIGRGIYEAPDIDGIVRVKSEKALKAGEILRVKMTAASEHDLEGVALEV